MLSGDFNGTVLARYFKNMTSLNYMYIHAAILLTSIFMPNNLTLNFHSMFCTNSFDKPFDNPFAMMFDTNTHLTIH